MEKNSNTLPRKSFLGTFAAGATVLGLAGITSACENNSTKKEEAKTAATEKKNPADEWFDKLNGKKHKMVYDVPEPHQIFPFAWPRVFLITNEQTGTKPEECGVVVVLRHDAIGYAMKSELWEKYKFGEMFKADDPKTKKPSTRNPFWQPAKDDFKIPGVDMEVKIGINQLQEDGVMFCVCGMALQVLSTVAADMMKMKAEDVKKEWMDGLLPNIQVVPSGVWALGRAQEHGCAYVKV
jgi:intracellular sulfur oxidation DsrE/DsrF family protein